MPNDFTITKIDTAGQEKWDVNYILDTTGSKSKFLLTQGKYLDRPIKITVSAAAGTYASSVDAQTNSVVTPSVTITNANTYNFSTTQPQGTAGTNYLTIDPSATATAGTVTPTVTVGAGYVGNGTLTGNPVSTTPTIEAGDNYYVPIVTPSFSGGTLIPVDYTGTPTLSLSAGGDSTMSNITIGAKDTTNYPYYFKVNANSGSLLGTTSVTRAATTYTNAAGVIAAHSAASVLGADTAQSVVTINANSDNTYVSLKGANITTGLDTTNFSTYFDTATSSSYSIAVSPYYTATAGYLGATSTTINNGGTGYWNIKTTSLTEETTIMTGNVASRGTAYYGTGWITSHTIPAATFSNAATNNVTYVDISNDTNQAPILISGDYLYINRGYTDNLKISLAKLVPDMDSLVHAGNTHIQPGYSALDKDGNVITGTMPSATATITGTNTVTPSASVAGNSYITLSSSDTTGISITATGGGTASVTAIAATDDAGYAAPTVTLGSATLNASSNTTTETKYVTGVVLLAPTSGTRTFTISVPNGSNSNLLDFTFTVDSSYNVTVG